MAHITKIGGTAYEISGGKTKVNGTGYGIKGGKTRVNGTGYDVSFSPPIAANFADNDWATIVWACQNNAVPDTWAVGNQKAMVIGGTSYLINIIGKNHDTYADDSGTAPLTFQMHNTYGTQYPMNSSATNSRGWSNTVMRKTTLPTILALMPSEVQMGIKEVTKNTKTGGNSKTILTSSDKLFLLSEIETLGKVNNSGSGEGSQYSYYANGNSSLKTSVGGSNGLRYWFRSPLINNSTFFCSASNTGTSANSVADVNRAIVFAFCF